MSDVERAFLKKRKAETRLTESELARRAIDIQKDIYEALEEDWYEIERRAGASRQSIGVTIAELLRAALEAERKGKK